MQGDIPRNLADARVGNRFDTWLFIPGYAGFLFMLGVLLMRVAPRKTIVLTALAAIPAIAICDWIENAGIDHAIGHVARDGGPLPWDARRISTSSIVKWTLLVVVFVCSGVAGVLSRGGWLPMVIGILPWRRV